MDDRATLDHIERNRERLLGQFDRQLAVVRDYVRGVDGRYSAGLSFNYPQLSVQPPSARPSIPLTLWGHTRPRSEPMRARTWMPGWNASWAVPSPTSD